jgi:hypothetical protein
MPGLYKNKDKLFDIQLILLLDTFIYLNKFNILLIVFMVCFKKGCLIFLHFKHNDFVNSLCITLSCP